MMANKPIGFFDSGVGGSSIWKEVHRLLPNEHTIYLADSANAPYGNRTPQEIVALSIKNIEKLIEMGCKIIVVACNTATTNAIDELRSTFDIPIIGIEPAIKPAALQTTSNSIGILATKGTLGSALFHKTAATFTKEIQLVEIIGEGLVPLIEAGKLDSPEMLELLQNYINPMLAAKIDYLVLGCSHYPYIIPQLRELLPAYVKIIDSGAAVAKQTKLILEERDLLRKETTTPTLQFYTNKNTATLARLLSDVQDPLEISVLDF